MLAQSIRASRSVITRRLTTQQPTLQLVRTFIVPTAIRRADIVQDLYLRELKNYKPAPIKENDADAHVKPWSPPTAPKVPDLGSQGVDQDLKTYEAQAVEVEGTSASSGDVSGTAVSKSSEDWFEEDLVFEEEKDAGGH